MAEESETLKVRMIRTSGQDKDTQWFEYRPAYTAEIVKIEWELDTMDVELDKEIAESLLRLGYATLIPEGSAPSAAPPPKPKAKKAVPRESYPASKPESQEGPVETPPATPSWLKPSGEK